MKLYTKVVDVNKGSDTVDYIKCTTASELEVVSAMFKIIKNRSDVMLAKLPAPNNYMALTSYLKTELGMEGIPTSEYLKGGDVGDNIYLTVRITYSGTAGVIRKFSVEIEHASH